MLHKVDGSDAISKNMAACGYKKNPSDGVRHSDFGFLDHSYDNLYELSLVQVESDDLDNQLPRFFSFK